MTQSAARWRPGADAAGGAERGCSAGLRGRGAGAAPTSGRSHRNHHSHLCFIIHYYYCYLFLIRRPGNTSPKCVTLFPQPRIFRCPAVRILPFILPPRPFLRRTAQPGPSSAELGSHPGRFGHLYSVLIGATIIPAITPTALRESKRRGTTCVVCLK